MTIPSLGALVNPVDLAAYLAANPIRQRIVAPIATTVTLGAAANTDYVGIIKSGGTLTLPDATTVDSNSEYKAINADTVNQTVGTTAGQTINGSSSTALIPGQALDYYRDGNNWRIG